MKRNETKRNRSKPNETKSGKIFDIFRPEKEKCSISVIFFSFLFGSTVLKTYPRCPVHF